ncbi:Monoacylglycerol lipase ABHD12 [Hondaea fermentalgiana]|uniref:Monoacylglycerol lipase ABHD12 n=1 Tax=Hondaea fermentalgiana TaxID=2315210 RepID=A0A2R5G9D9_9STRA|nr:Monoacylglycerol lipase ABHD12 [Hondaea fermentalgiana]|eukprot:GBG27155.1 Monoacylglycerol lipase ABHD12 [Hondaea fermentalgiana]
MTATTRLGVLAAATAFAVHTEKVQVETLVSAVQMTLWLMLGLLSFLIVKQNAILYIPHPDPSMSRAPDVTPLAFGDMPYEDVEIVTEDGVRIHSWLILQSAQDPAANRACNTLIYFHGNAGNVANRLPFYASLHEELKVNILAVDYRGFGSSQGEPSEPGLKEDARAVARFAADCKHIDPDRVFIFGRSLGGAVAIDLLASADCGVNVRGLVVENTFLSLAEMAMVVYPFLKPLRPFLRPPFLRNEWRSRDCIARIPCPILFISGGQDELIPPEQMRQLFRLSRRVPGTQFRLVPNGGHNDTPLHGGKEYTATIGNFFEDIISDRFVQEHHAGARRDTGASVDSILSEPDDFHHHIFS